MAGKNNMRSELKHTQNPYRMFFFWIAFYSIIAMILTFAFLKVTDRIKTHSVPSGSIELNVPYSKYVAGEVVTFTLKNNP